MNFPRPGLELAGPDGHSPVTLGEPLGSGAFGIVFNATSADGFTRFAVKFPQAGMFSNEAEIQAFLNEVQAAREIDHENVLRVVHVETNPEEIPPYLVLEFAEGGTLKDMIEEAWRKNTPFDVPELLEMAKQLVRGMTAINARMLHRDLKPDNILLKGGVLKIGDFGLSKLIGAATRSRTFKGGQHMLYMAPEGWRGEKNEIQLDMYALGIVLFELAGLTYPYVLPADPMDFDQFRDMHMMSVPKPLAGQRSDLPTRFIAVVNKLLEKRARDRYQDWNSVYAALDDLTAKEEEPDLLAVRMSASISERHQAATAQRLGNEKQARDLHRKRKIDSFQAKQLVQVVRERVDAVNAHSEQGKITLTERGPTDVDIQVPYGQQGSIAFFTVDPPLKLRSGFVRYAGVARDARGCGFNLLLVRNADDDNYGDWSVCKVRVSAISSYRHGAGCTEFGFGPGEITEIGRAERAMHIYTVSFSSDVHPALDGFLEGLVEAE